MVKESGHKWDGRSRIPNEEFKKNFDEIFNKKEKLKDIGDRMEEEIEKIKND